jgi:hypothetical protein
MVTVAARMVTTTWLNSVPVRLSSPDTDGHDHGGASPGACRIESEIPSPAKQASRLVVEWTADLCRFPGVA